MQENLLKCSLQIGGHFSGVSMLIHLAAASKFGVRGNYK